SEDGDIIDCIDIYKQHAFDHPALKNHKIQMKPSMEFEAKTTTIQNNRFDEQITSQIWTKSGDCPDGTIPVRRVSREDIRRASSPSRFGKKARRTYSFLDNALQHKGNFNITAENVKYPRPISISEAVLVALGFNYLGARSDINVWNPPLVEAKDYSSGQIWLLAGLSDAFESVEAGWAVRTISIPRSVLLYLVYQSDGYGQTGCFNHLCSGFVQISPKIALGAAIEPVSHVSQKQYYFTASIMMDLNTRNWWLTCANNVIGYWPASLFGYLKHSATAVQWGGEVHSPNLRRKPHTLTSMGSGRMAADSWQKASYHTNMRIKDYSLFVKYP
ncbi:hypothetical protein CARUB_v10008052mg, partial [Capsella rubella]